MHTGGAKMDQHSFGEVRKAEQHNGIQIAKGTYRRRRVFPYEEDLPNQPLVYICSESERCRETDLGIRIHDTQKDIQ
jgi:hypothetical protein